MASQGPPLSWKLASREYVRETLSRFNVKPRKKLGQHFLVSKRALESIAEAVDPRQGEVVYEIGAGLGALTAALAERGAYVVAIEVDGRLVEALRSSFRGCPLVEVLHGDALSLPLPRASRVVGNVPYSISSKLIVKLLREQEYELAVLTLQREFALRLVAKTGTSDYGRLSVIAQLYASIEIAGSVSRKAFYPEPEVDSLIVKLKPRREYIHLFPRVEELTAPLFSQRRRKLSKVLKKLGLNPADFAGIVDLEKRVYELTPGEILRMTETRHTQVLPTR